MSLDQARAFIEKMKSDEAFRDRIMAIEDVDARIAAANSEGFGFTKTEVKEVQSELSDQKLDGAAGGGGAVPVFLGGEGSLPGGEKPVQVFHSMRPLEFVA